MFQVPDAAECEQSVYTTIQTGYRLIDTAAAYLNEEAVGTAIRRAIADGICTREELSTSASPNTSLPVNGYILSYYTLC